MPGAADDNNACSTSDEGGGVSPKWDDGINETLDNRLLLPSHKGPTAMRIEIWSENTAVDDKIGTATVSFKGAAEEDLDKYDGAGLREWHEVGMGHGCILLTLVSK